jgi:hypothetical protein
MEAVIARTPDERRRPGIHNHQTQCDGIAGRGVHRFVAFADKRGPVPFQINVHAAAVGRTCSAENGMTETATGHDLPGDGQRAGGFVVPVAGSRATGESEPRAQARKMKNGEARTRAAHAPVGLVDQKPTCNPTLKAELDR